MAVLTNAKFQCLRYRGYPNISVEYVFHFISDVKNISYFMSCEATNEKYIFFTSRVKLKPYSTETFEFSLYYLYTMLSTIISAKESIIMYSMFFTILISCKVCYMTWHLK